MGIIIHRPRSVPRPVLSEPTNRTYVPPAKLARVDAILLKEDDEFTSDEVHFLLRVCGEIDDAQNS